MLSTSYLCSLNPALFYEGEVSYCKNIPNTADVWGAGDSPIAPQNPKTPSVELNYQ